MLKERKEKRKKIPEILCSLKLSLRSQTVIFLRRKQHTMPLTNVSKKKTLQEGYRIFMEVSMAVEFVLN